MPYRSPEQPEEDEREANALEKVGRSLLGLFADVKNDRRRHSGSSSSPESPQERQARLRREWAADQVEAAQMAARLEREDAQRMVRLQADEERTRRINAEKQLYADEEAERRANRLLVNAAMEEERTRRILIREKESKEVSLQEAKEELAQAKAQASKSVAEAEMVKLQAEAEMAIAARQGTSARLDTSTGSSHPCYPLLAPCHSCSPTGGSIDTALRRSARWAAGVY